jgi:hypothetical protein
MTDTRDLYGQLVSIEQTPDSMLKVSLLIGPYSPGVGIRRASELKIGMDCTLEYEV